MQNVDGITPSSCLRVQNVDGTHSLHTASRAKTTKTEAELRKADQKQHAFRYVGSALSAGQPFTFIYRGTAKRQCCQDFQMLLGDFYDMTRFPVRGGRQVIAGRHMAVSHCSCNCLRSTVHTHHCAHVISCRDSCPHAGPCSVSDRSSEMVHQAYISEDRGA